MWEHDGMSVRAYERLFGFAITFGLGVAVSSVVIRLWYRYVVGACATDWTLALVLGLVIAVVITAVEAWSERDAPVGR